MRVTRIKFLILIAMSLIGLWSSLTVLYLFDVLHQPLPFCGASSSSNPNTIAIDCNRVLSSPFSSIHGIPLDAFAALWFIINLFLILIVSLGSDSLSKLSLRLLFFWRFMGLLIIPYLLFLEFFVIRAICIYCTVMHIAIIIDFIIVSYFLFYKKGLLK